MSLNSGSCWDILGIEATEDKKIIKRAYHKLLRQYKPDEKPDEFKILYKAYQDALEWEDYSWNDSQWEDEYDDENNEFDNSKELDIEEEWEVESELRNDYYERWKKFEEKVDALTYDNNYPELFNKLENWKFLEALDVTSDLELYKEASEYLFTAVTNFDEKHPSILLNEEVIRYFDKIFLWKQQWQEFDSESTVFEYLEIKKDAFIEQKNNQISYSLASSDDRIKAFFIDIFISMIITFIFSDFQLKSVTDILIIYFIMQMIFFVIFGVRTVGSMIMKIKVLEGNLQEKPTMTARMIRWVFTLISILIIMTFIDNPLQHLLYLIPIALNFISLVHVDKLLQDYSATRFYKVT